MTVTNLGFPEPDPFREWSESYHRIIEQLRLDDVSRHLYEVQNAIGTSAVMRAAEQLTEQTRALQSVLAGSLAKIHAWPEFQEDVLRRAAGIEGVLGAQSAAFADWRDDIERLSETLRRAIRPWSFAAPGVLDVVDEVMQEVQRRSSADVAEDIHLDDIVNISSRAVAARADSEGYRPDPLAILSIILTVFFGLLTWRSNDVSTTMVTTAVREGNASIDSLAAAIQSLVTASLGEAAIHTDLPVTHRTSRRLHLRVAPSVDAKSLRVLDPGTEIVVLLAAGAWFEVAFREDGDDALLIGWIYGRYLRPLQRTTE